MDSLTQIVLGAAVGEVVLGKKIGNKALLWGAVAGTIPDLDVFVGLVKETIAHRGFTHSFFFAFLMSPIIAYLMRKLLPKSKATYWEWFHLFFWGFVTHILLDVQTVYGTELLWPNHARLAISNVFVVDPLYTIPFLICVIAVLFIHKNKKLRRILNWTGIIYSTGYLLLTLYFKSVSMGHFKNNLKAQNIKYNRIETGPTPFNAVLWYANIETDSAYYVGHYSLLDKDKSITYKQFDKNFELREKLKNYRNFKRLNHFSKDWYVLTQTDSALLYANMRFGTSGFTPKEMNYVVQYILTENEGELSFKTNMKKPPNGNMIKKYFWMVWERLKGK